MKTSAKLITLVFVALSSVAFSATTPNESSVTVIESKHKNMFVFKVDKSLKGAEVLVYAATGDLVASEKLSTKKMTIDFKEVKFGTYTILVKKNGTVQEFNYEKKLVLSQAIR